MLKTIREAFRDYDYGDEVCPLCPRKNRDHYFYGNSGPSTLQRGRVVYTTSPPVEHRLTVRLPDSAFAIKNIEGLDMELTAARAVLYAGLIRVREGRYRGNRKWWSE